MIEQSTLPTRRVNISTQKMLGGTGSILILLGWMTGVGILFGIVGVVLWLISMYQLSNILGKPTIFQKVLIGFILNVAGMVIAFAPFALTMVIAFPFGLLAKILFLFLFLFLFNLTRDETLDITLDISEVGCGALIVITVALIAIMVAYAIFVFGFYLQKQAYEILAQATTHNLFKIAGLLLFIGAITTILFGLGVLLIIVGYIVLPVAFFTAPNEVEVQST
jgi:Predicted membrane protein